MAERQLMTEEANRRASFERWPGPNNDVDGLVAVGFYYTGERTNVKCIHCGIVVEDWNDEHGDPAAVHRDVSPECPGGFDVAGMYNHPQHLEGRHIVSLAKYGIYATKSVAYPNMRKAAARLESFATWPKHFASDTMNKVNAGFYYTGQSDKTNCYWCGFGIHEWKSSEDAFEEHAKYNPDCPHLLLCVGKEFVKRHQRAKQEAGAQQALSASPEPQVVDEGMVVAAAASDTPVERGVDEVDGVDEAAVDVIQKCTSNSEVGMKCVICMDAPVVLLTVPCMHLATCALCGLNVTTCALCRKPIEAVARVYVRGA